MELKLTSMVSFFFLLLVIFVVFTLKMPALSVKYILEDEHEPGAHPHDGSQFPVNKGYYYEEEEQDYSKEFSCSVSDHIVRCYNHLLLFAIIVLVNIIQTNSYYKILSYLLVLLNAEPFFISIYASFMSPFEPYAIPRL